MEKTDSKVEGTSGNQGEKKAATAGMPRVERVTIDAETGTVTFRFEPSEMPMKDIVAAITSAGDAAVKGIESQDSPKTDS
jgi:copper chaperone CopZ